jgi:hypothetical protein
MKKFYFFAVVSLTLLSCSNNVPKCDDPEILQTVIDLMREQDGMLKEWKFMGKNFEELELDLIKTNSIDKELNKCECEASIKNGPPFTKNPTILYEAQTNSNGDVIITTYPVNW